jgi:glycosyltransferase involved in cell wall biosynthesis
VEDLTIGIKTFLRPEKVRQLLYTIHDREWEPAEVIVADDGKINEEKRNTYEEYSEKLPLKVLDLEFDLGNGASRNKLAEECETEYLLMLDDDMMPPENIPELRNALKNSDYGGISGILKEYGDLRACASDIFFEDGFLVLDIREEKKPDEHGVIEFDYLPSCAMFRTECLEQFPWDDFYVISGEHIDFYLNHYLNSDWRFGLKPEIVFEHRPDSPEKYLVHRESSGKIQRSNDHLQDKWNIKDIVRVETFINRDGDTLSRKLKTRLKKYLPVIIVWKIQEKQLLRKLRNLT